MGVFENLGEQWGAAAHAAADARFNFFGQFLLTSTSLSPRWEG